MLKLGAGHITVVDPDASRCDALGARLGSIFGEPRIVTSTRDAVKRSNRSVLAYAGPPRPDQFAVR